MVNPNQAFSLYCRSLGIVSRTALFLVCSTKSHLQVLHNFSNSIPLPIHAKYPLFRVVAEYHFSLLSLILNEYFALYTSRQFLLVREVDLIHRRFLRLCGFETSLQETRVNLATAQRISQRLNKSSKGSRTFAKTSQRILCNLLITQFQSLFL